MASTWTRTRISLLVMFFATAAGPPSEAARDVYGNTQALGTLTALLGKGLDQPEVTAFCKELKDAPEIIKFDDRVHYEWKEHGISFLVQNDAVSAIHLYADGVHKYKQYRGELPAGLRFSNIRGDVENKLGQPETSGGDSRSPFWVVYAQKGVGVTYISADRQDQANKIHHITISAIRKK
jgi:hypothetical protein